MRSALLSLIFDFVLIFAMYNGTGVVYASPKKGSASISGVVIDAKGKPVSNAVVTYQSGGGDKPHAVRTDSHGHFNITKLRWDNYDLRASTPAQISEWEKNVMLRSGQQKSVTLRLTSDKPSPKRVAEKSQ